MNRTLRRWPVVAGAVVSVLIGCARHEQPPARQSNQPSLPQVAFSMKPTEGMWLYTALPLDRLAAFHFQPTSSWTDHLRLSSVQIDGGSGSFISADGLILTNHHVAAEGLGNISSADKDYINNGFLAKSLEEEIPLPGFEAKVLISIEDVTDRVNAAVDPKLPADQAFKARRAVMATISRESEQKTGLQSDVVTLFGGARYHLYRTKRYSDIRAVFAPEISSAFFGGDPDNFEYPRYDLDISILRAYENGKPAHVQQYLRLSPTGVSEGDLIFVSGNPGHTDRLLPASALAARRDKGTPLRVDQLERLEKAVLDYGAMGPEQHRQAQEDVFWIQNSLKAMRPQLAALRGGLVDRKLKEEQSFRTALRARENLRPYDSAWDRAEQASRRNVELIVPLAMFEWADAFQTDLFQAARTLVRLPIEDAKPDDQRLPEFTQSRRARLEHRLLAEEPTYPELEIAKLTASLQFMSDKLGADSEDVKKVLAGKSPAERARELVSGTKLADVAERRRLKEGGAAGIESSQDPMIQLAKLIDPQARQLRQEFEAQAEEPLTQALTDINRARFALLGNRIYPDATFTLRLAFGLVEGYEQDGQQIPPWTTIGGAYEHEQQHKAQPPYQLPPTWQQARNIVNPQMPLNFVCTADIIGGNSGSPVINRAGDLVGVIFDSNRQGLTGDFEYSDIQARSVCVDSRGILEALRKIYRAERVLNEINGEGAP